MDFKEKYIKYKNLYFNLKQRKKSKDINFLNKKYKINKKLFGGTKDKIKLEKLDFELIRVPEQIDRFKQVQNIITKISLKSRPESFNKDEPYYPLNFAEPKIKNFVLVIGYTINEHKLVIFMTLIDKMELQL